MWGDGGGAIQLKVSEKQIQFSGTLEQSLLGQWKIRNFWKHIKFSFLRENCLFLSSRSFSNNISWCGTEYLFPGCCQSATGIISDVRTTAMSDFWSIWPHFWLGQCPHFWQRSTMWGSNESVWLANARASTPMAHPDIAHYCTSFLCFIWVVKYIQRSTQKYQWQRLSGWATN